MNNFINYSAQSFMDYFNMQPSTVKGRYNAGTEFYRRILYNDVFATLDFNLPELWKINWFRFWLFRYGSIATVYTKRYGWVINPYSIKKLDYQYNPATILCVNAYWDKEYTGVIGVNAGIIHLFDDWFGFDDIVTYFAEKMANADSAINVNLMNSKLAYIMYVDNKKQADSVKEMYSKVTTGDPLVVTKKGENMEEDDFKPFFSNVKQNFISTDLNDLQNAIRNQFLTLIGVNNANTDKRERLVSDEVNANNDETRLIIDVIIDNLRKDFAMINKISGLNLSVEKHFKGGEQYAALNALGNVSV